jgi:hypothetical protein
MGSRPLVAFQNIAEDDVSKNSLSVVFLFVAAVTFVQGWLTSSNNAEIHI